MEKRKRIGIYYASISLFLLFVWISILMETFPLLLLFGHRRAGYGYDLLEIFFLAGMCFVFWCLFLFIVKNKKEWMIISFKAAGITFAFGTLHLTVLVLIQRYL